MRERRPVDSDAVTPWAGVDAPIELRDDADDFEDALLADMRRRGFVDVL